MTAIGPAGLALIGFVGLVAGLAAVHSVELYIRRAIGAAPRQ